MDKTIIKKELDKIVTEAVVSGAKVTNRAKKASDDENKAYYKDVEKKMSEYDKNLKQEDKNAIEPKKTNAEGKDKEYHEQMEILNGQEMIQYDLEPSDQFKDRAKKSLEGDSTMGNKTYEGDENGNTEEVWGASGGKHTGKELVKNSKASAKKRSEDTPQFNSFGDDIENKPEKNKVKPKSISVEGMKRLKFKKEFDGVGNALKLIPEAFKVDNKVFEMTDGKENYKIKWEGTVTEGKAVVIEASSKGFMNEAFMKVKHLMNYKAEDTLGTPTADERVKANKTLSEGLKKKPITEGESKPNPWAICTDSVGRDNKDKYEACVKKVKKQYGITEGDPKDPEDKYWDDMATWNERFSGDDEDSGDYDD